MKRLVKTTSLAGLLLVLLSTAARAAIVSTTGDIVQIPPPPSVVIGALESDTRAFAFDEQQNVTLTQAVQCDITVPGTYDEVADLTPGTIPAGTVVSSHFIHSDNVGAGGGPHTYEGSVVVDAEIICIQVLGSTLDTGDVLGAPGTVYPTGDSRRQLKLSPDSDIVIEHTDRVTVTVHLETVAHADQVRIITVPPTPPPPPPPAGEGCTPGFWKQPHHFDSWTAPFDPGDLFSAHFENAFPGLTLLDVLRQGGGGLNALGRHTVAALLNAASVGVDFGFTPQQLIDAFNAVFPGTKAEYNALKAEFESANEEGCPLS